MRYVGGKSRIAKKLAKVMLDNSEGRVAYIEPFLGGAAVAKEMGHNFDFCIYNDAHIDLMLMWIDLIHDDEEFSMPDEVSEEDYHFYKNQDSHSAMRGFVGFASSFGGKFFGGYARGKTAKGEPRNYAKESKTNIENCLKTMKGKEETICALGSYTNLDVVVAADDVVYCDPPYQDTQGYTTGDFDHDLFWKTMTKWSKRGAKVFVSEYTAPDDWECIWQQDQQCLLGLTSQGRHMTTEKLFVWKGNNE